MTEIYEPIEGCNGYLISSFGVVIGPRGPMTPVYRKGYAGVSIRKKVYRINRLVCRAFNGEPPSDSHHAAHRDGNRDNNSACNLYWATAQQNGDDLARHGSLKGVRHPLAQLSEPDIKRIRELKSAGMSVSSIAQNYPQVCRSTVSHAALNRNWQHVK